VVALSPRVSRLRAPNPGAMTLDGTNGYIVDGGDGAWIAIDPGPDIPEHVAAFVDAARERDARYEAILVTHGHPDHYPAAAPLARLRSEYRFQFVLKSPHRTALSQALAGCLDFCSSKEIPETAVIVDVDPTSLS